MRRFVCLVIVALSVQTREQASAKNEIQPVPFKVPAQMPDIAELPWANDVELGGWLGQRVLNNERNRLAKVDLEPLLAGFRQRPGSHPWIGEHIGKWMHAATLAWAYTGDPALRKKLDYAAAELIKTPGARRLPGHLRARSSVSACTAAPTGTCGRTSTT